tara:strand:+ start:2916 stop:3539 length:624 start_codon:yes stop_codon:yes gene_type:complete
MINKDTKLFGSFSRLAGNVGCTFFNSRFQKWGIDAIYKSYSITNIEEAVCAARCLNFSGFAVSMPYKSDVIKYVDKMSTAVENIGASNTIVNDNGVFIAYNTDYVAAYEVLHSCQTKLFILGKGGYAKAVVQAARDLNLSYEMITRETWADIEEIRESTIFNCTPVKGLKTNPSNKFIDCDVGSPTGQMLAHLQATKQFKLYTGIEL